MTSLGLINYNKGEIQFVGKDEAVKIADLLQEFNNWKDKKASGEDYELPDNLSFFSLEVLEELETLISQGGIIEGDKFSDDELVDSKVQSRIAEFLDNDLDLKKEDSQVLYKDIFVKNTNVSGRQIYIDGIDDRQFNLGVFADDDGEPAIPEWYISNSILLEAVYAKKNLKDKDLDFKYDKQELSTVIYKLTIGMSLNSRDKELLLANLELKSGTGYRSLVENEQDIVEEFITSFRKDLYEVRSLEYGEEIDALTEFLLRFPGASYEDYQKRNLSSDLATESKFVERKAEMIATTVNNLASENILSGPDKQMLDNLTDAFGAFALESNQSGIIHDLKAELAKIQNGSWKDTDIPASDFVKYLYEIVQNSSSTDLIKDKKLLLISFVEIIAPSAHEMDISQPKAIVNKGFNSHRFTNLPANDTGSWLAYLGGVEAQADGYNKVRIRKLFDCLINLKDFSQADKEALKHLLIRAGVNLDEVNSKANNIIRQLYHSRKALFADSVDLDEIGKNLPVDYAERLRLNLLVKKQVLEKDIYSKFIKNNASEFAVLYNLAKNDDLDLSKPSVKDFIAHLEEKGVDIERILRTNGIEPGPRAVKDFATKLVIEASRQANGQSIDLNFDEDALKLELASNNLAGPVSNQSKFHSTSNLNQRAQKSYALQILNLHQSNIQRFKDYPGQVVNFFAGKNYRLGEKALNYEDYGFGDPRVQKSLARLSLRGRAYGLDIMQIVKGSKSIDEASKKLLYNIKRRGLDKNLAFVNEFYGLFNLKSDLESTDSYASLDLSELKSELSNTVNLSLTKTDGSNLNLKIPKLLSDLGMAEVFNPSSNSTIGFIQNGNKLEVDENTIPPDLKRLMSILGLDSSILLDRAIGKPVRVGGKKNMILIDADNLTRVLYRGAGFNKGIIDFENTYQKAQHFETDSKEYADLQMRRAELIQLLQSKNNYIYSSDSARPIIAPVISAEYLEPQMKAFLDNLVYVLNDTTKASQKAQSN